MATIGAEKVSVDCSAHVLFAEMPGWAPAWIPHGEARTFDRADVQAGKPATSLLRLHCALTI
jgi:hypothetical protein